MPKPNRWRDFVREWGRQNNLSYACALSKPECKDAYRRKYGVAKKLPQKRERELMGMEDVNVAPRRVRRVRRKRPIEFIIEEEQQQQPVEEENDYPIAELVPFQNIIDENARKQRFRESKERFGMSSEDLLSRFSGQAEKAKQAKRRGLADVRQKALESEMRRNVEKRRQQLELSRMMGEDYRPLPRPSLRVEEVEEEIPFPREAKKKSKKPKPILVIEEEEKEVEAPKKKRGRPRKYSSAEEAYKAKIAQNKGYKQGEAKRIKSLMEKMKAPKEASYEPLEEAFPTASSVKKPMNIQVKPREEEIIIRPKAKKAKKPKKKKAIPHEPLEEAFPTASSVKKPMNIQVKPREEEKEPEELKGLSRYKRVIKDYYISKNPNIFDFNIKNKQKLKEAQQRADDLVDDYIEQNIDNFARGKYDRIDEELLKLLDRIRNPQKPKPRLYEPLEFAYPQAKDVKKPIDIQIKSKKKLDWRKSGYYKYIKFPPEVEKKLRRLADKDEWGLERGDYFLMDDGTKIEVTRVGATVKGKKSWEVSRLVSGYFQIRPNIPPVERFTVEKIGWFFTRWELHFTGPVYKKGTGPRPKTLEEEAFLRNGYTNIVAEAIKASER